MDPHIFVPLTLCVVLDVAEMHGHIQTIAANPSKRYYEVTLGLSSAQNFQEIDIDFY